MRVVTARRLGAGTRAGLNVPTDLGAGSARGMALSGGLTGNEAGGFAAVMGATLAAGAGVGVGVFGIVGGFATFPTIAIFSSSEKNAFKISAFMVEVYPGQTQTRNQN